jgi:hypothetical protein
MALVGAGHRIGIAAKAREVRGLPGRRSRWRGHPRRPRRDGCAHGSGLGGDAAAS